MELFKKVIGGNNTWIECKNGIHYFVVDDKKQNKGIIRKKASCLSEAVEFQEIEQMIFGGK